MLELDSKIADKKWSQANFLIGVWNSHIASYRFHYIEKKIRSPILTMCRYIQVYD